MELKRSQNACRNILWGLINRFVGIFLPFANRTVLLYVLGVEFLGLSSLCSSILQVLNLAEMGVGSAMVYSMYRPIAEGNRELVCALLALYRKIYRYIGIIILLIGLLVLPFFPLLIHGEIPNNVNLLLVYFIYLLNTVISYFFYGYKISLPTAFQRNDIVSNISSLAKILESGLQIFLLYIVADYYIYLLIMPMVTIINNIIMTKVVDRYYPEYRCGGLVPADVKAEIRQKVFGLMINKICLTTRNALDSICLSMYIGLSVTAIYNNYLYAVMAVTGIFCVIGASIVAGVGNSIIVHDSRKNYLDMRRVNCIYMFLSGWAAIAMLCMFQTFMELWMGHDLLLPFDVVILLVVYFYLLRMGDIRAVYTEASGLWWETRYRAIIEFLANIILNLVLGKLFGVRGIICATLLSLFFINFCWGSQIVFQYYFKNGRVLEYFLDHMKYAFVTFLVMLITFYVSILYEGDLWYVLLYRTLISLVLPVGLYYLFWHKSNFYRESMEWFLTRIKLEGKLKFLLR